MYALSNRGCFSLTFFNEGEPPQPRQVGDGCSCVVKRDASIRPKTKSTHTHTTQEHCYRQCASVVL